MRNSIPSLLIAAVLSITAAPLPAYGQIKVGISAPATGLFGHEISQGTQLAVDAINSAGGIKGKRIETMMVDNDCRSPHKATTEVEKLAAVEKVSALIDYPCLGTPLMARSVAAKYQIPMLMVSTAADLTVKDSGSLLRVIGRDDRLGTMVADYVSANFQNSSVGVLTSPQETAFDRAFRYELAAKKIEPKNTEPTTGQDKPPPWALNVQVLVAPLSEFVPAWVARTAKDNPGLNIVVPLRVVRGEASSLVESASNVTIIANPWGAFFSEAKDAIARAVQRGFEPTGYFIYQYASVQVFAAAASRVSADLSAEAVVAAAKEDKGIPTILGQLRFDKSGDLVGWRFAVLHAKSDAAR